VQAAVKHALAQFSISPTLDFELDASIQHLPAIEQPFTKEKETAAAATSIFKAFTEKHQAHFIEPSKRSELRHWKEFYVSSESGVRNRESEENDQRSMINDQYSIKKSPDEFSTQLTTHHSPLTTYLTQLHNQYILAQTDAGFIVINQQAAHERIIYERLLEAGKGKPVAAQRSMFPVTIELAPADTAVLEELMNDLQQLGYLIEPFGKNTFVVQGTPADVTQGNEKQVIDSLLEQYKHFSTDIKFSKREKLVRSLAWQQSIKAGRQLSEKEMQALVNDLFQCVTPNVSPDGNPIYLEFKKEQLEKMFQKPL
jgi:DNA mismatch repair protein MutL